MSANFHLLSPLRKSLSLFFEVPAVGRRHSPVTSLDANLAVIGQAPAAPMLHRSLSQSSISTTSLSGSTSGVHHEEDTLAAIDPSPRQETWCVIRKPASTMTAGASAKFEDDPIPRRRSRFHRGRQWAYRRAEARRRSRGVESMYREGSLHITPGWTT